MTEKLAVRCSFLKSALFWRILVSFLAIVSVLGWGLTPATELRGARDEFERLVQHDLKLADDAEVLLRITADLETGKRGYLLTGVESSSRRTSGARAISSASSPRRAAAEPGREDELVELVRAPSHAGSAR